MHQQEIISEIKALSCHYPKRARSPHDETRWLMDWANDLAAFNGPDVRLVCAQWRSGQSNRMPTPGELVAKCRQLEKPIPGIQPLPQQERPSVSPEERERVRQMMVEFSAAMKGRGQRGIRDLARKPGETGVEQGRRLWPSHEVKPRGPA